MHPQDPPAPQSDELPLTELRRGTVAVIHVLGGTEAFQSRLRNMGVREGEEIMVVKSAPLADPVEYYLGGMHISLRRSEARAILVGEVRMAHGFGHGRGRGPAGGHGRGRGRGGECGDGHGGGRGDGHGGGCGCGGGRAGR